MYVDTLVDETETERNLENFYEPVVEKLYKSGRGTFHDER